MQVYRNERKFLHKKRLNSHRIGLEHQHGRRYILIWETNMAAVELFWDTKMAEVTSLFWDTNMADVTSRENVLLTRPLKIVKGL